MSSKRRLRRRGCDGKVRYPSKDAAELAAIRSVRDFGGRFNNYKCRFCGGYHVGHMPNKVREKVDGF